MGICNHQSHSRSRSRQVAAWKKPILLEEGQNGKKMIVGMITVGDDEAAGICGNYPMDAEIVPDLNEYQAVFICSCPCQAH